MISLGALPPRKQHLLSEHWSDHKVLHGQETAGCVAVASSESRSWALSYLLVRSHVQRRLRNCLNRALVFENFGLIFITSHFHQFKETFLILYLMEDRNVSSLFFIFLFINENLKWEEEEMMVLVLPKVLLCHWLHSVWLTDCWQWKTNS